MPFLDFYFPIKGKDANWSVINQPPITSSDLENVRPYDVYENRARGGQRPGLKKWADGDRIAGNYRIDRLVQISFLT